MTIADQTTAKLDVLTETVADLTTTVADLVRGLDLICTTLGTHSEMLGDILEACSVDEDGAPQLHEALVEIAGQIERQTEVLTSIGGNLDGLGATVQVAVIQGFARALNNADEDGVIPEDSEDHAH